MLSSYAIQEARRLAQQELANEALRLAIDEEEARLRQRAASKRWWHRFGRAMIGSQKTEPQQSKEEADANIAAAEAKRLRKQQKRVAHASH